MKGREAGQLALALAAVAALTAVYALWLHVGNSTIVSLSFLLVVLVTAAASRLWVAVTTSLVAMVSFNFFFLPPIGTLTIAEPQNWVALFTFLAVSLVASNLSSVARARALEAAARRDEVARLFDLSRDVLLLADVREALALLAASVARRFELDYAAICLPHGADWDVHAAGPLAVDLDRGTLSLAFAGVAEVLEFDAHERTYAGHRTVKASGRDIRLIPLRLGNRAIGLLAAAESSVEPGALDALAGVVAIAIERVQFLEERKTAEMARQSEELKSALLASLGHDLRTPLTAIRIAGSNLTAAWLNDEERREQAEIVLAETERLTRLFQNILEMARIDAGAVSVREQWTHPSEIVEAALTQVEHTIAGHPVSVDVRQMAAVRVDPQLTAGALAHLLENAAQYTAAGSAVEVTAEIGREELVLAVRDHGPGISEPDLPRLFERFYRGADAKRRTSGTGMGLAIARGLLAVEGGRIWAENCADGGARFTIAVPAATRDVAPIDEVAT